MAIPVFPPELPLPDLPLEEEYEDPGFRTEMNDGSTLGRRRFTKRRLSSVPLNWQNTELTKDQYVILQSFLDLVGGSAGNFSWPHPITGKVYTVRVISQGRFGYGSTGQESYTGGIVIGEA